MTMNYQTSSLSQKPSGFLRKLFSLSVLTALLLTDSACSSTPKSATPASPVADIYEGLPFEMPRVERPSFPDFQANITDFGLFVEVEEGIEGLVHVSELSSKKIKSPAELYKEGQEIQAKVIHVSAEERRLGLSIKQIKDDEDRRKPKEFHAGPQEAGQSLGDLLKAAQ